MPFTLRQMQTQHTLARREFLAGLFSVAWIAPLGLTLVALVKFLRFEPPTVGSTQFELGSPQSLPVLPAYFESGQVWLFQDSQGYAALDSFCTHLGCTVRLQSSEDEFRCPCHGSRFALNGTLLEPV